MNLLENLIVIYIVIGVVLLFIQYHSDHKKSIDKEYVYFSNGAKTLTLLFFPSFIIVAGTSVIFTITATLFKVVKKPKESYSNFAIWWRSENSN